MKRASYALILISFAAPASAAPLPQPVQAMIEAALQSDEPQTAASVIAIAKRTNPESVAEIDALTEQFQHDRAAAAKLAADVQREKLASAGILSLWRGQAELGGSWSTGNSRTLGLYSAVKLSRAGLNWQHDLSASLDYQETDKRATTERVVAAWQPRYKAGETYYIFGLAQYEHDRFLGYRHRLTSGTGVGVVIARNSRLRLELEAGPALRFTDYYGAAPHEKKLAGRGSLDLKWTPWPQVTLAQEAAIYVQQGDTSASSTTSLETLLFGPLKARLSYNVQYERDAPIDKKRTDTISRASLVYSF